MGNKIIKFVEAVLGGIATFILLYFLQQFILNNFFKLGDWRSVGFGIFFLLAIMVFSFFMVFIYYWLLTKNDITIPAATINQNTEKSISDSKGKLILLGMAVTVCYYGALYYFSDAYVSFFYSFGLIFLIPFILTRMWSWHARIFWIAFLFSGGFLFNLVLAL